MSRLTETPLETRMSPERSTDCFRSEMTSQIAAPKRKKISQIASRSLAAERGPKEPGTTMRSFMAKRMMTLFVSL